MAPRTRLPLRALALLCMVSAIGIRALSAEKVCIVGAGIGGTSAAYFMRREDSVKRALDIHIFEATETVGGRLASVELAGDTFEKGGSVIHPKNLHMVRFVEELGLERNPLGHDQTFGVWTGSNFTFQTVRQDGSWWSSLTGPVVNLFALMWRYGLSPIYMQQTVKELLGKFLRLYEDGVPAFERPEAMLQHVGLYNLTLVDLEAVMLSAGVSERFIDELITAGLRVNYNQDKTISGLAGSVSIAGFDPGLWSVKGGNMLVPEGLIKLSNATLHLDRRTVAITRRSASDGGEVVYELEFSSGEREECGVVVIATPLENAGSLRITPPVDIAPRAWQHTHATFVRGKLNGSYFGVPRENLPDCILTVEDSKIPVSCIGPLRDYPDNTTAYKVFSRQDPSDELLDTLFSERSDTVRVDWAAYPHYSAPEKFAPFLLDDHQLYYVNTFESAASSMECSAVAARNVAKLMLSRLPKPERGDPTGPELAQVVDRRRDDNQHEL